MVKADGLAAGKGVFVCRTQAEADAAVDQARAFGGEIVVEELLEGEEASIFALCDGSLALPLPAARDYKRALDGDEGPNTGGMGAYAPISELGSEAVEAMLETVHRPVLAELAERRSPFVGILYAGLMLTPDGPRVLEFNCRFGDPETQSVLPLLESDPVELLASAAAGDLGGLSVDVSTACAVTVVLAARGYPESGEGGVEIRGLEEAESAGAQVCQAGTALRDDRLVSAGGRVLSVTGLGPDAAEARGVAYRAIDRIDFPGAHYRRDIALKAAGSKP